MSDLLPKKEREENRLKVKTKIDEIEATEEEKRLIKELQSKYGHLTPNELKAMMAKTINK